MGCDKVGFVFSTVLVLSFGKQTLGREGIYPKSSTRAKNSDHTPNP